MKNRRGQTMCERLKEEFGFVMREQNEDQRKALAYKALGAADIAIEFGLITYTEWEGFVKEFFRII